MSQTGAEKWLILSAASDFSALIPGLSIIGFRNLIPVFLFCQANLSPAFIPFFQFLLLFLMLQKKLARILQEISNPAADVTLSTVLPLRMSSRTPDPVSPMKDRKYAGKMTDEVP